MTTTVQLVQNLLSFFFAGIDGPVHIVFLGVEFVKAVVLYAEKHFAAPAKHLCFVSMRVCDA